MEVVRRWRRCMVRAAAAALFAGGTIAGWRAVTYAEARGAARALAMSDSPHQIQDLQSLCARYPHDPEMSFLLGVAYRRAGRMAKAVERFGHAESLRFSAEDLCREHYLMQFQLGQVRDSEPHLVAMLKQDCCDEVGEEIYECLVKGYVADIRLHEAMVCADYWIEWRPRSVKAHLARAYVLEMASERPQLMHEYREVLGIDDTCVDALIGLGRLLLEGKQVEEARAVLHKCLVIDARNAHARLMLAAVLRHLGNQAEAQRLLQESLNGELSDEEQCLAYKELGQLAIERRDYLAAVTNLKRAVQIQPDDNAAHYALGVAFTRVGDKLEAERELEEARHLESLAAHLTDVMHEIVRQPEDADVRCEAGKILYELGHDHQALACLLSALRCDRQHKMTHEALACLYAKAGRQDAAERHLQLAQEAQHHRSDAASHAP